jgi:hypothetical protein
MQEKTDQAPETNQVDETSTTSNTRRIINLAVGDAIVFLIFSVIGRQSHAEAVGPGAILQVILTALPFALGWFIVSPFMGAFRRGLETQPRAMAIRTSIAWIIAWPAGLFLRWLFSGFTDFPPLTFALITLFFNLVVLLVWRWPYALTNSMRKR